MYTYRIRVRDGGVIRLVRVPADTQAEALALLEKEQGLAGGIVSVTRE